MDTAVSSAQLGRGCWFVSLLLLPFRLAKWSSSFEPGARFPSMPCFVPHAAGPHTRVSSSPRCDLSAFYWNSLRCVHTHTCAHYVLLPLTILVKKCWLLKVPYDRSFTSLISAHRLLIISSIFRHEVATLIERLCFYALGGAKYMAGKNLKPGFTQDTHVSKLRDPL